jgi:hypothetical protein
VAIDVSSLTLTLIICVKGAFTIKRASCPKVQVFFKDYAFSSLKHGLHVLDRANYRMIVPTSKV